MKKTVLVAICMIALPAAIFATGQQDDGKVLIGAAMSSFSDKGQTSLHR